MASRPTMASLVFIENISFITARQHSAALDVSCVIIVLPVIEMGCARKQMKEAI